MTEGETIVTVEPPPAKKVYISTWATANAPARDKTLETLWASKGL